MYVAGCAWALISIALWVFAPQYLGQPLSGVAWHAHEMLWGFVATIAVAFLFTASATWTGHNPIKGRPLGWLCLMWLIARLGYLFGGSAGFWLAGAAESAFFAISAASLLRVMIKGKSRRNYGVPWLVLGLGAANVLYLMAVLQNDYVRLMQRYDVGVLCMAVIALLIARRVIPFFAMRMVPGLTLPMHLRTGHAQMVMGTLAIVLGLSGLTQPMAVVLVAVGIISLVQTVSWKPMAVLRKPMLWILYLGYMGLGMGLLFAAWHYSGFATGVLARSAVHIHIIAMGGFSLLIIGMVTRTALGHTGRPLVADASIVSSYYLMVAAVIFRLAALWPSAASRTLLHATATAWILCMALYLWRFAPMLFQPRYSPPAPPTAQGGPATTTGQ